MVESHAYRHVLKIFPNEKQMCKSIVESSGYDSLNANVYYLCGWGDGTDQQLKDAILFKILHGMGMVVDASHRRKWCLIHQGNDGGYHSEAKMSTTIKKYRDKLYSLLPLVASHPEFRHIKAHPECLDL